jgi:hypothetical protein
VHSDESEAACEADTERRLKEERAAHRMFVFIVTVLPAVLVVCAWAEAK